MEFAAKIKPTEIGYADFAPPADSDARMCPQPAWAALIDALPPDRGSFLYMPVPQPYDIRRHCRLCIAPARCRARRCPNTSRRGGDGHDDGSGGDDGGGDGDGQPPRASEGGSVILIVGPTRAPLIGPHLHRVPLIPASGRVQP